MTVIQQLFPLSNHQGIRKPTRLSDFRQNEISCEHWLETLTSQTAGNATTKEVKPCTLQYLVSNRDGCSGMDSDNITKSVATDICSDMEVTACRTTRRRINKTSPSSMELEENRNFKVLSTLEQTLDISRTSQLIF